MSPFDLTVMMYHYVHDGEDPLSSQFGIPGMPAAHFQAQIDSLAAQYEIISWPVLREALAGGDSLPARACLLTFDDGVIDHYTNVCPLLKGKGLSGLFFALARRPGSGITVGHKLHFLLARLGIEALQELYTQRLTPAQWEVYERALESYSGPDRVSSDPGRIDAFKRTVQRECAGFSDPVLSGLFEAAIGPEGQIGDGFFLTPAQVQDMAAGGMHFGGHSLSHPWLDAVGPDRREQEIRATGEWLAAVEPGPWAFAYPYGGTHPDLPALLRENGFTCAFTTVSQSRHADPFLIGRYDAEEFSREMTPLHSPGGTA